MHMQSFVRKNGRKLFGVVARVVPVVLCAAAILPAKASAAGLLDLTCTGTQTVTFSPGLLLTPQKTEIQANTSLEACLSASDGTVASGTSTSSRSSDISCVTLDEATSSTRTFRWSNGNTSTFAFNQTVTRATGVTVVTQTGTIVAGEFAGDAAVLTVTEAQLNVTQCLAPPGITGESGAVVLQISRL